MRIAVNAWFLDQPATGSGQYLLGLLGAFAAAAPEHEFLLVVPPGVALPEPGSPRFPFPGLRAEIWRIGGPPGAAPGASFWRSNLGKVLFEQAAFPRACRRWGAEVAHVPYWGSPLWPRVPTAVTVHDLIPMLLPAYRGGPLVRLYTRLVAASARRAALVLTDSLASQRDIERHLALPPTRVRCVYLGVGDQFSPEPDPGDDAARQRYGLPSRYVLYLAGHDVRKNVGTLVEAFATVARADSDALLAVGGALPEPGLQRPALRGPSPLFDPRPLVSALGLEGDVRFLGYVAEADKPAIYRGAACAVFPSRYEGFGLPVLEALACGTPLVTSNASSLPELLGDAGFAVDPDDVPGMAGAILACLVDESLAAELRRRGPARAAQFTWAQAARETLLAYAQCLVSREAAQCGS